MIDSSNGVQEANNVGVIRKELMPWSNGLETEEQEVPDDVLVVMVQSIKAGDHVAHFQLLLCILEQRNESSLGTLSQLVGTYTHIESVLPQHGLPVGAGATQA